MLRISNIEKWEIKWLFYSAVMCLIVVFLEQMFSLFSKEHAIFFSIITGIPSGIIGTIFIFYLQRRHINSEVNKYFETLPGTYTRIAIGQDNTPDDNLEEMRSDNIGLNMSISKISEDKFSYQLKTEYWRSSDAIALINVTFTNENRTVANGKYEYIQGDNFNGHMGSYQVHWERKSNKLICFYHHLFPRDLQFNPDNNRGWEVWKKI
jgi:hypothetical protein